MNRAYPFGSSGNLFKPAIHHIFNVPKAASSTSSERHSFDDEVEDPRPRISLAMDRGSARLSQHSRHSSAEGPQGAIPLIEFSRTPSPYARTRSAGQSEDEDEDFDIVSSRRPLVATDIRSGGIMWRKFQNGGLGSFFFATWLGWQVYVALLVLWLLGCGFGLLLMNRFIMLTGTYKFPEALFATYIQLVLTHILLLGFSSFTRGLSHPLRRLGLSAVIAPAIPPLAPPGYRGRDIRSSFPPKRFLQWFIGGYGGIAGSGIFEFDRRRAWEHLPLALVFVGKVVLSNISFAYTLPPIYTLSRIGIVPLALIFTAAISRNSHSVSTLSSSLIATLSLLVASIRPGARVSWEGIVAGVFSSFFAALYPILLLRAYRNQVANLVPQGDILTGYPSNSPETEMPGSREESRAYYRVLHYTSLLSILVLTPIVLLFGDVGRVLNVYPFLDVPWFWFLVLCGAIGSTAVFISTPLLVKATSPLTVTFLTVPRSAFQLWTLSAFSLPPHSLLGIVFCALAASWYLVAKREEGRTLGRLRLEGR